MIITILFPIILFGLIETLLNNDFKILKQKEYCFVYISVILSLVGKFIAEKKYNFVSKDSAQVWCGLADFWKNIGSILLGYFDLLGALPADSNVKILDKSGIRYSFALGVALSIIIGTAFMYRMVIKNYRIYKNFAMPLSIVFFNVIVFAFSFTTYGSRFFESRYLIIPFIFMLFCLAGWVDSLSNTLLLKKLGCILLVLLVNFASVASYHKYIKTRIDVSQMDKIKEKVAEFDSPIVYFSENFTILARNMRVYDITKVYRPIGFHENQKVSGFGYDWRFYNQGFWGDYTYYSKVNEYNGTILLFTDKNFYNVAFPDQYKPLLHKVCDFDEFEVYTAMNNIFAFDYINARYNFNGDFINGGYDEDGVRYLNPQGVSFGPYWLVKKGSYKVVIEGENLRNIAFDVYSSFGEIRHDFDIHRDDDSVTLFFSLEKDVEKLEFCIRNNSETVVKLYSLILTNSEETSDDYESLKDAAMVPVMIARENRQL